MGSQEAQARISLKNVAPFIHQCTKKVYKTFRLSKELMGKKDFLEGVMQIFTSIPQAIFAEFCFTQANVTEVNEVEKKRNMLMGYTLTATSFSLSIIGFFKVKKTFNDLRKRYKDRIAKPLLYNL
jgi:hypothetical protein